MPDANAWKYSQGDTALWKTKYYALCDYVESIGGDLAEVLAYLATDPGWSPTGNPSALSDLNAVNATTSDDALYQLTHSEAYTSLAANIWFIVRFPSANTGAVTIKVDSLTAKNLYKDGAALSGGEVTGIHLVCYDLTNDRFDLVEPSTASSVNVISKSTDYSVVAADLTGYDHLVVLVDASAADRTITFPAPATYSGKTIQVIADVDPAGNACITNKSGATEYHTGYAKGDFIKAVSDGTNDIILDEDVTIKGYIAKTSDEIMQDTITTNPFDTNATEEEDIGGHFDFVTNFRYDAGGIACRIKIEYGIVGNANIAPKPYVSGSYPVIPAVDAPFQVATFEIELTSTGYIRPDMWNEHNSSNRTLYGNAGKTESYFKWRVIKRLRP